MTFSARSDSTPIRSDSGSTCLTSVLGQEKQLIELGSHVATIDSKNAALLELAENVAAAKLQGGATREIGAANQLVMP